MIKDMGNMKNGKYRETSKMSDLICENYPMVLVMSRFGIDLGFGEKNIGEVCRQNKIDTYTFLTVVNFLTETETIPIRRFFDEYAEEVHKHMSYEEKTVFPYVRNLLEGKKDPKYNITIFRKRHDQIEMKITELKNLILKYYPGPDSNLLNNVLFDIFATEQDLASHNRVEDYIFVPAILSLEKQ